MVSFTLEQFSVFVNQLRKCEFIKTICNGLCSMPTFENETLNYRCPDLQVLLWSYCWRSRLKGIEKSTYVYLVANMRKLSFYFFTIKLNYLFNTFIQKEQPWSMMSLFFVLFWFALCCCLFSYLFLIQDYIYLRYT